MNSTKDINSRAPLTCSLQVRVETAAHPKKSAFKRWASLANERDEPSSVCLCIVSLEEMQALNCRYRGQNKPTNVLSFAYALENNFQTTEKPLYLGDIVLCHARIEAEASAQGKTVVAHYAHLTIHGMLHLLGYDHVNPEDAAIMESKEIHLLAQLNIDNPYQVSDHHA